MGNVIKIIIGILLTIAATNNFRIADSGGDAAQLAGYLAATFVFLGLGLYLIYSGITNKSGK